VATTFYLILSGAVLVNIPETDENNEQLFMKTVNELGAGEAFGVHLVYSIYLYTVYTIY